MRIARGYNGRECMLLVAGARVYILEYATANNAYVHAVALRT